ncbi:MAG: hypothetical protein M3Z36_05615, partial [Acidobacteriota bacterium]|nr:hypothetical protein [Acidobacteriota bacterium]
MQDNTYLRVLLLAATAALLSPVLSAQQFQCNASVANPPLLRVEGLNEHVGEIQLICTGGTPTPAGQPVPRLDVQIFLNTNVTSRLLDPTGASEALLLINDPAPGSQIVCAPNTSCPMTANGLGGGAEYARSYNVFEGVIVGANSVVFPGVPIDPPGNNFSPISLRIANIRVNANAMGAAPNTSPPLGVNLAIVIGGNPTAIANPNQTAGFVTPGLVVTTSAPTPLQQCASAALQPVVTVNVGEGFPKAFKLQGIPGAQIPGMVNNTESMLTLNSAAATGSVGVANFATRFKLRFNNVPSGVTVYVPVSVKSASGSGQAVLTASESGPFFPITGFGGVAPISGGTAVYEIVATNPSAIDNFAIPVFVSYSLSPGVGTATVSV